MNQFLSPLLRLPHHLRHRIVTFALGGHHIRIYSLNGRICPRACPECYYGLPYAMRLGPAVPLSKILVLSKTSRQIYIEIQGIIFAQNEFMGYPTPLSKLFKRMLSYQANQIKAITVNILVSFKMLEDNKTVVGLSEEVVETLKVLCGMRGLREVSVVWDGKHDNHGEAHDYFKARVVEMFTASKRMDVQIYVPMLGNKPQQG